MRPITRADKFQIPPGTHGLYSDLNCTILKGILHVTGSRESWLWRTEGEAFNGNQTFYLKGKAPDAAILTPHVCEHFDLGLVKGASRTVQGTTKWRIKRGATAIGWMARGAANSDAMRWYIEAESELNQDRIKIGANEVLTFEVTTDSDSKEFYYCENQRLR